MTKFTLATMLQYVSKMTNSKRAYTDYEIFLDGVSLKSEQLSRFRTRPVEFIDTVYSVFRDNPNEVDLMMLQDLLSYCPYLLTYKTKSVHEGIRKVCTGIKDGDIQYIQRFDDRRITANILNFLFAVYGCNQEVLEIVEWGFAPYDFGEAIQTLIDPEHALVPAKNGIIEFRGDYADWLNGARYGTKEF